MGQMCEQKVCFAYFAIALNFFVSPLGGMVHSRFHKGRDMQTINFGDKLVCTETGKEFIAAADGCTTNYATDNEGNVYSDEGVDIRQRRELLDRSKPFGCYVSEDGKYVTGWKSNKLGTITYLSRQRVGFCREGVYIRVTDCHGGRWYGRGAGCGVYITLRPYKS